MLWTGGPLVFRRLVALFIFGAALLVPMSAPSQQTGSAIRVIALDEFDKPVQGVHVEVKLKGAVVATTVTNEKGEAELPKLLPGTYEILVSKDTFEPLTQTDVGLTSGTPVEVRFTMIPKVQLKDVVVNVQAGTETPIEKGASPAAELGRAEVKNIPAKPATVTDTLPLIPGVVRSSEGEIKISGTGEHRSALVVNTADVTDPATGQFGVTVPVDSVETIEVFKTPYLAQFGRFTAGVVSVETRRGGDKWNFELNDPLPEFRIRSGHLRGIREASPRIVFNGPLVANKFYFSEGLEYDLQKRPDRTLPFPFNESKQESLNSFTQLDYILSPANTLSGTFHVAPRQMQFVNLNFFNPQPVTPTFSAHDYTGTVIDRWTIGNNLLESTLAIKRFSGDVWGQGEANMVLAPAGNSGNYFSQQRRRASRAEWIEVYSLSPIDFYGAHNLKFGSSVTRTGNRGDFAARPVEIRDNTGNLLKRIDWVGGHTFNRHDLELAFFAQDHWVLAPRFSVDVGTRFERQGITETVRVAPRIGLAWQPFNHQQTTVRGGFGLFYDRVPLSVFAFTSYPEQVITTFD
ncbi:MAG: TonB-dependent receptor, partial [Blastocatellia bacterium]